MVATEITGVKEEVEWTINSHMRISKCRTVLIKRTRANTSWSRSKKSRKRPKRTHHQLKFNPNHNLPKSIAPQVLPPTYLLPRLLQPPLLSERSTKCAKTSVKKENVSTVIVAYSLMVITNWPKEVAQALRKMKRKKSVKRRKKRHRKKLPKLLSLQKTAPKWTSKLRLLCLTWVRKNQICHNQHLR